MTVFIIISLMILIMIISHHELQLTGGIYNIYENEWNGISIQRIASRNEKSEKAISNSSRNFTYTSAQITLTKNFLPPSYALNIRTI